MSTTTRTGKGPSVKQLEQKVQRLALQQAKKKGELATIVEELRTTKGELATLKAAGNGKPRPQTAGAK